MTIMRPPSPLGERTPDGGTPDGGTPDTSAAG
jgi:hypothetical protein